MTHNEVKWRILVERFIDQKSASARKMLRNATVKGCWLLPVRCLLSVFFILRMVVVSNSKTWGTYLGHYLGIFLEGRRKITPGVSQRPDSNQAPVPTYTTAAVLHVSQWSDSPSSRLYPVYRFGLEAKWVPDPVWTLWSRREFLLCRECTPSLPPSSSP